MLYHLEKLPKNDVDYSQEMRLHLGGLAYTLFLGHPQAHLDHLQTTSRSVQIVSSPIPGQSMTADRPFPSQILDCFPNVPRLMQIVHRPLPGWRRPIPRPLLSISPKPYPEEPSRILSPVTWVQLDIAWAAVESLDQGPSWQNPRGKFPLLMMAKESSDLNTNVVSSWLTSNHPQWVEEGRERELWTILIYSSLSLSYALLNFWLQYLFPILCSGPIATWGFIEFLKVHGLCS